MIRIHQLSKSYGSQQVLDKISLSFGKGEIHGIVGDNGSGKTTLFKCICGLETSDGTVLYDEGELKNITGYLPANPHFFSKMTGEEYLRLLCNARELQVPDLKLFNLFELPLRQYAETYSTGMQKKLAITGLLLQKNEVFILDEPFNGVDISSYMIIKKILLKLKELDKIIVLSSHIFSSLEQTCDTLHFLKNGRIEMSVPKGDFGLIESEMERDSPAVEMIETIYKNS